MQNHRDGEGSSDEEQIKRRIRQAIESKGLKIKQFSRESGMAYPSLRDYYSGLRKPGFDAVAAIVRFTGVSGDWLLTGKGTIFPDKEPASPSIDEGLLGQIAQAVESEFARTGNDQSDAVAENTPLYAPTRKAFQKKLNMVGEHSVIAASVYNRVAQVVDRDARQRAIKREVADLVRLNRSIEATHIDDEAMN